MGSKLIYLSIPCSGSRGSNMAEKKIRLHANPILIILQFSVYVIKLQHGADEWDIVIFMQIQCNKACKRAHDSSGSSRLIYVSYRECKSEIYL